MILEIMILLIFSIIRIIIIISKISGSLIFIFITLSVAEASIGVSLLTIMVRRNGNDYIKISIFQNNKDSIFLSYSFYFSYFLFISPYQTKYITNYHSYFSKDNFFQYKFFLIFLFNCFSIFRWSNNFNYIYKHFSSQRKVQNSKAKSGKHEIYYLNQINTVHFIEV